MSLSGLQTAVAHLYPPRCLGCGETVDHDFGLCSTCWRDTAFIGGALCDGCGTPLPGAATVEVLHCDSCMTAPKPWVQGRSALIYRDTGRKLVLGLKHGDRQEIARPASLWMANAVRGIVPDHTLIVPIPLHWMRLIKRRYNQSALLAKELARQMGLAWCPDLLQRSRRTPSLDGMGVAERFTTLQGAIRVHEGRRSRMIGRPILLVDDVMTSGATLSAATEACQQAGSGEVRVVTLARAVKEA